MYGIAGKFADEAGKTSSWVMIGGYGLYSLGELLVSGLGLAMIARYVPEAHGRLHDGRVLVGVGVSQYIGGLVANYAAIPSDITDPLQSLPIYTALFNKLGVVGIVCTVIAIAVLPLMNKLSATHHARRKCAIAAAGSRRRGRLMLLCRAPVRRRVDKANRTGHERDAGGHELRSHGRV